MATTAHWPTTATQVTHVSKSWPTPNHPQHAHVSRAPNTAAPDTASFPATLLHTSANRPETLRPIPPRRTNRTVVLSRAHAKDTSLAHRRGSLTLAAAAARQTHVCSLLAPALHIRAQPHGFTASRLGIGSLASLADLTARRQLTPASKLAAGREPHPWPSAPTWSGMRRRKRADPRSSFRWLAADAQPSPTAP